MALVARKLVLCTNFYLPLVEAKRFKAKINLRKPQKPHFERALFLTLTKPKFENKLLSKTKLELCAFNEPKKPEVDNPYERFIAAEILEHFKESKFVLFCHRNTMSTEEAMDVRRLLIKSDMQLELYGKKAMKLALQGTPYEAVLSFYFSHNAIVFSPETNIKKCLKICRKFPSLLPLAAIVEGRLINRDELLYYSNIPNLQTAQAGFVQTLNSVGGQVVSQLNAHQNTLVAHLEERIKQLTVE